MYRINVFLVLMMLFLGNVTVYAVDSEKIGRIEFFGASYIFGTNLSRIGGSIAKNFMADKLALDFSVAYLSEFNRLGDWLAHTHIYVHFPFNSNITLYLKGGTGFLLRRIGRFPFRFIGSVGGWYSLGNHLYLNMSLSRMAPSFGKSRGSFSKPEISLGIGINL